jgi:hypothetical protein
MKIRDTFGKKASWAWASAADVLGLVKPRWRSHCRLMEASALYRAAMMLLADAIVAQIDVHRLLQVVHEMLINLWVGHQPTH